MAADLIDPGVNRLDLLAHRAARAPGIRVLGYARPEGDLRALAARRAQLAAHIEDDGELRRCARADGARR